MKLFFSLALFLFSLVNSKACFSQPPHRIDSLENTLQNGQEDTNRVKTLNTLSQHYSVSEPAKGLNYAKEIFSISKKINFKKGIIYAYENIGAYYFYSNQYDSANTCFLTAVRLSEEIKNNALLCAAFNNLSALSNSTGDYNSAISYSDNALAIANTLKDSSTLKANIYGTRGLAYMAVSNYMQAQYYLFKALKLNESLDNKGRMSNNYYNIGRSYWLQGDNMDRALQYFKLSLETAKQANDRLQIAESLNHIGETFRDKKELDTALNYFQQAFNIFEELGHTSGMSMSQRNIGLIYGEKGDINRALNNANEALKLSKQIRDKYGLGNAYQGLGEIYLEKMDYKKAMDNFSMGLALARETNQRNNECDNLNFLARCAGRLNDTKSESDFLKQYISLKDSIIKEETVKKTVEMETRYNSEKKAKQIALLTQDKTFQQQKYAYLRNAFAGGLILLCMLFFFAYRSYHNRQLLKLQMLRTKIASDLHDDIGSTLSSISIFSIIARQESKDVVPMLEQIGEYSRKMLESMADIVWTINPENDNFEKIILRMRSFAFELLGAKNIDFKFNVDESVTNLKLTMEARKNLYLIFKEATNNLVKYAEANSASFSIKNVKNNLTMIIRDNGKGFDLVKQTQGNGLKNMKARALEIGAKFLIESEPDKGTTIQILMKTA